MNIEHRTTPIEHWVVDGKAYRLATEADVCKECLRSDTDIEVAMSNARSDLVAVRAGEEYPYVFGEKWKFAYVQDDSILALQRTPVPALGDGWFLLTAEDGEFAIGDKITSDSTLTLGWMKLLQHPSYSIADWLGRPCYAARHFGPAKEPEPAAEAQPQPAKPIDWTKPVRTKDGRAVRVLCTDGPGDYPVVGFVEGKTTPITWTIYGYRNANAVDDTDLENAPQRFKKTWWMNVFDDGSFDYHETKQLADDDRGRGIFACVPFVIDCEEGEGL